MKMVSQVWCICVIVARLSIDDMQAAPSWLPAKVLSAKYGRQSLKIATVKYEKCQDMQSVSKYTIVKISVGVYICGHIKRI